MHTIVTRNVCEALPTGVHYLLTHGRREQSRAGAVLVATSPIMTVYTQPCERVLFSEVRDANPFFHLAEAMWMLLGRNDAEFLDRFVSNFGQRFAEKEGYVHGAYGDRWLKHFGYNQLDVITNKLRENSQDRQAVLAMWDATADELDHGYDGADDLRGGWHDRPCNTHAYFRVREAREEASAFTHRVNRVLDMTVCCRSNDIIWGAYGANAVHFSVLQEYLAACIGVSVGCYYQLSNNFHAYETEIHRLQKRAEDRDLSLIDALTSQRYNPSIQPRPMVTDAATFLKELALVVEAFEQNKVLGAEDEIDNSWLLDTLQPVLLAHQQFKRGRWNIALEIAGVIAANDWRLACLDWLWRRAAGLEKAEVRSA